MKIAHFTNTYAPHVGGVARSVLSLVETLGRHGCETLVVAPRFAGIAAYEKHVYRVPAIQHFGGSDFSIPLPAGPALDDALDAFEPDVIHSHHPFLLGDTALRVAAARCLPIVYTFHTRYDLYGHYVGQDSPIVERMLRNLSAGYCNLASAVVAPSRSIADYLVTQDVDVPIEVIATGIDLSAFDNGDASAARAQFGIAAETPLIGHVSRLAPEKNPEFLTQSIIECLSEKAGAMALIVGDGGSRQDMETDFERAGLKDRVRFTGVLTGAELENAYAAMDVFVFASKSETQGLVIVEAMASGTPIVALDAPGVRDVVNDQENGLLFDADAPVATFARGVIALLNNPEWMAKIGMNARATALDCTEDACVRRMLALYADVIGKHPTFDESSDSLWDATRRSLSKEVDILSNFARAFGNAVMIAEDDDAGVTEAT
ncbi:glycosyltransferase [uncultured Hoeflea sp.]|uniref:glycosyltransferase n=1 Tax=uncultured Hoeflea sp. TaxID=538666 RepID=UPI002618EA69|nr:glycosyltransferase [uncultured Hoeflea sp.]